MSCKIFSRFLDDELRDESVLSDWSSHGSHGTIRSLSAGVMRMSTQSCELSAATHLVQERGEVVIRSNRILVGLAQQDLLLMQDFLHETLGLLQLDFFV